MTQPDGLLLLRDHRDTAGVGGVGRGSEVDMSVLQVNIFTCDVCGLSQAERKDTEVYRDPVVVPPEGWGTAEDGEKLACPKCREDEG